MGRRLGNGRTFFSIKYLLNYNQIARLAVLVHILKVREDGDVLEGIRHVTSFNFTQLFFPTLLELFCLAMFRVSLLMF